MTWRQVHPSHRWDDVSYHGSPVWRCDFCGCSDLQGLAQEPRPKAEVVLAQETRDKEMKERCEHLRMKAERDRFEELHRKYGEE